MNWKWWFVVIPLFAPQFASASDDILGLDNVQIGMSEADYLSGNSPEKAFKKGQPIPFDLDVSYCEAKLDYTGDRKLWSQSCYLQNALIHGDQAQTYLYFNPSLVLVRQRLPTIRPSDSDACKSDMIRRATELRPQFGPFGDPTVEHNKFKIWDWYEMRASTSGHFVILVNAWTESDGCRRDIEYTSI
jgi:hypothetical protein